jgi:hypothetical protein
MTSWMMFYYAAPAPERFVDEARGLLTTTPAQGAAALATFLGRVMAANPARIPAWIAALADLPPEAAATLRLAAWLSGTPEGRAHALEDPQLADAGDPPDLLAGPVEEGFQLDLLWSWYFATGDVRAVAQIVSVLRWMGHFGAAARFKDSAKTAQDADHARKDAMFQAATWSLQSLMQQHPPLKRACETICDTPGLDASTRVALAMCLAKVDPDGWRVDIDPATSSATVTRRR